MKQLRHREQVNLSTWPRSLRVSRTLSLRCSGSPLAVPRPFLLPPFVSPPSLLSSSLMAQCCFLWYWLGFYRKLQQLTTVSQKHLSTSERCWDHIHYTLNANFHQVFSPGRAFSSQVIQYMWAFNSYAAPSILWNKRCLPFRTVDMRALSMCHLALDLSSEEQGTFTRPFALSGRLHRGLVCVFSSSLHCYLIWCFISNDFATSSPIRSWQKGDRPDNGDVEPCSNQPKKINLSTCSGWFIKLWEKNRVLPTQSALSMCKSFSKHNSLYKLDTSMVCCSVMLSTSDASGKQI